MRLSEGNPFKTCAKPQTQPKTQRRKPLWERNGLNISRFKLFVRISYFLLPRVRTKSGWLEVDQELDMGCQLLTRTFPCWKYRGLSCSSPLATPKLHYRVLQGAAHPKGPIEIEKFQSLDLRSPWGATEYKNPSSLEIRKKYENITKSPISGLAPEIRKNYRKITKMVIFWPIL